MFPNVVFLQQIKSCRLSSSTLVRKKNQSLKLNFCNRTIVFLPRDSDKDDEKSPGAGSEIVALK
jgi:hypothetical protein